MLKAKTEGGCILWLYIFIHLVRLFLPESLSLLCCCDVYLIVCSTQCVCVHARMYAADREREKGRELVRLYLRWYIFMLLLLFGAVRGGEAAYSAPAWYCNIRNWAGCAWYACDVLNSCICLSFFDFEYIYVDANPWLAPNKLASWLQFIS